MAQQSIEVIRGIYDSFGKGDLSAVVGQLDQQIEWNHAENFIFADRNPHLGPHELLDAVLRRLGAEWEGFSVAPEEWLDAGNHVVVLGTYTGRHRETGNEVRAQFAHVWGMRAGRVVRFQQYTDTKQFADAITWRPVRRSAAES